MRGRPSTIVPALTPRVPAIPKALGRVPDTAEERE